MFVKEGEYGIVKFIDGPHEGRIGYYDNDEWLLKNYDNVDKDETVAVVYFGEVLLAQEHCLTSFSSLNHVTMHDLVKRKEELYFICSPFNIENELDYEEINSYLSELHFVDSTLLDKLVEQRYMSKLPGLTCFNG